ncbi:MAG TPA: DNA-deoxyinosine glycosylase [Phycisphaerae bacterium]|nr:DNA-deoxyinosine glycosylase [Phycisphaerae bacterium]HPS52109.1 DNA-deoxyinosine glycosylase [Phycisphaerae bacterium]
MLRAFKPVAAPDARVLVLGCMPGVKSLEMGQYYAHPHNAFWPICEKLFAASPQLPYKMRCDRLIAAGIALWDVLHSCRRKGSLDSNIEPDSMQPNDFAAFFRKHRKIRAIFFNGTTPQKIFTKQILPTLNSQAAALPMTRLISTSPACAAWNFEQKLENWRQILMILKSDEISNP